MRSGGSVSCLPRASQQTDGQTDRQEVQREMPKKHVEKVKGEGGTGAGHYVPLEQTHAPSVLSLPRRKVLCQSGPS